MRRRLSHSRRREASEVNVTAFLSLMVVLVPFLLITSVFSQVVILDLQLESLGGETNAIAELAALEVIVREERVELVDQALGRRVRIDNLAAGYDLEKLSLLLREIKARAAERVDASILMEPQLSYDTLIRIMDTVRLGTTEEHGTEGSVELFPRITIGDAPPRLEG